MNLYTRSSALVLVCWLTLFQTTAPQDFDSPNRPDHTGGRGTEPETGTVHNCGEHSESCPAVSSRPCWLESPQRLWYNLHDFANKQFQFGLSSPRNAVLKFQLCSDPAPSVVCRNGKKSPACITLPGLLPTSTGEVPRLEELEPNIPSMGIKLVYEDGDVCEVTNRPRKTIIKLPCNGVNFHSPESLANSIYPVKAFEGVKNEICQYFVEFPPSKYGCPVEDQIENPSSKWHDQFEMAGSRREPERSGHTIHLPPEKRLPDAPPPPPPPPKILSVTGCHDSVPARTTSDCHFAGQVKLAIHGRHFNDRNFKTEECAYEKGYSKFDSQECQSSFREKVGVFVGATQCTSIHLVSFLQINCTLVNGAGEDQDVFIKIRPSSSEGWTILVNFDKAVSFKERVNYRERFSKFVEYGVGGLKNEIDELYRRAFASRGTSPELLEQLGISHVKGILLFGPPGSGKTLLARTIGKILGSKQVTLVNAPEVISKYLGESERNLRSHFKPAQDHWAEYGPDSDLFVVIIDEIDAICKPRGKSDQSSASVAYDALVNQLLTLMDGLNEMHNILVLGLTNRKELLDPALLRPGRFEIQIEVNLPDEDGRQEIFEIHTRDMRSNGLLGADVNVRELATNTTRFSGAEIAGVVRAAASYALERYQKFMDPGSSARVGIDELDSSGKRVLVASQDFSRAIASLSPAYTQSKAEVHSSFMPLGYLSCGESHQAVIESVLDMLHVFFSSTVTSVQSLLLYGPRGSGKSTLAVHLATMGKFSFVKILTPASLTRRHSTAKVDFVNDVFDDAVKSDMAVIVLDDLKGLVEMVSLGDQLHVSHHLLHTLTAHLTAVTPPNTKLLIIGTMTLPSETSLDEPSALGLTDYFNQREYVALMEAKDIQTFILARNIHRLGGGQFVLPDNLELPVRRVVLAIDCACARSEAECSVKAPYRTSYVNEQHLLDCIMGVVNK